MMPWIVPGITRIEMSLLAWTVPKALEMPPSSIAGVAPVAGAAVGRPAVSIAANQLTGQALSDM